MDKVISPVYLLRSYAWAVLKENTEMDESDYNGLVPVVPVAEEPDIIEFGHPYLVYGYALDSTADLQQRKTGSMSMAIYSANFRELTTILTVLTTAFERQDDAAEDINEYTTKIPGFIGIRFGSVSIGFVEGGTPEDSEGGRQSGLINIRFDYYVEYDVTTRV